MPGIRIEIANEIDLLLETLDTQDELPLRGWLTASKHSLLSGTPAWIPLGLAGLVRKEIETRSLIAPYDNIICKLLDLATSEGQSILRPSYFALDSNSSHGPPRDL